MYRVQRTIVPNGRSESLFTINRWVLGGEDPIPLTLVFEEGNYQYYECDGKRNRLPSRLTIGECEKIADQISEEVEIVEKLLNQ